MDTRNGETSRVRTRDRVAVWLFTFLWLLPVLYVGTTRRAPPFPRLLVQLTNVTCLFTRAQPVWAAYYVQIRTSHDGPWIELDTRPTFGLQPFGHRTRLDRYLVAWGTKKHAAARDELAQWLMREHERRHPETRPALELRFVLASIAVRTDRPPAAAWSKPPLDQVPPNHLTIVSTHERRAEP
jgi:hypothetical protein